MPLNGCGFYKKNSAVEASSSLKGPNEILAFFFFYIRTLHLDIIKVFYSSTDAQVNCLKNNIKIYIKTAPTCFGAVTPSSGSAIFVLAKVTVVKIAN